jgi:HAD superfamily hydrolase (TIGR01549 family)
MSMERYVRRLLMRFEFRDAEPGQVNHKTTCSRKCEQLSRLRSQQISWITSIPSRTAMKSQQPQAGLVELMEYIDSRGIKKGICTRNFDAPVTHLLTTFLPTSKFHPVVTREFRPPKPDPAGILHIAKDWMHEDGGKSLIMVGDSIDDMTAGHRAGAATVLLVNDVNKHLAEHAHTDLVVKQLDDLIEILDNGFEGRVEADEDGVGA